MIKQQAILVAVRHYTNNADLVDNHVAGVDRRAVLDEAIGRVPAQLREGLTKQLGQVLEQAAFDLVSITSYDPATKSAAFLSVRIVDIVIV